MNYSELQLAAKKVAENECLINWSNHSKDYTYSQYTILVNNLRHWLGPTAARLDLGCEILKKLRLMKTN